ncbi:MAG: hypothetical protein ABI477_04140 [Chryseolinea sp.]
MYSVLIGNGINNIGKDNSWDNLIVQICRHCKIKFPIDDEKKKHFPLLYEEIFLTAARKNNISEADLKKFIAKIVSEIKPNGIHDQIRSLPIENILTTNYEFSLEGSKPKANSGVIKEKIYSIFRHVKIGKKKVWHIHGDCLHPSSINLGFEHYGGQLQQVRNYTATGTNYQSGKISKIPLISRLKYKNRLYSNSWIDLFFTTDIHIVGLTLGFVETELWWLLTFRARMKINNKISIPNKITYYLPQRFEYESKNKLDLFRATDVEVVSINKLGESYYNEIIDRLHEIKT